MSDIKDPRNYLPDPDDIGQSEYRAIYEHMKDALEDCPDEDRFGLALAMLDEFKLWADALKNTLKKASSKKLK